MIGKPEDGESAIVRTEEAEILQPYEAPKISYASHLPWPKVQNALNIKSIPV